jgi:hypothetical protein
MIYTPQPQTLGQCLSRERVMKKSNMFNPLYLVFIPFVLLMCSCWHTPKQSPDIVGLPLFPGGQIRWGGPSNEILHEQEKPGRIDYTFDFIVLGAKPETILNFYRRTLKTRGWQELHYSPAGNDEAHTSVLTFCPANKQRGSFIDITVRYPSSLPEGTAEVILGYSIKTSVNSKE